MTIPEQRTTGPWTLHEKLGEGGNATVWSATSTGRDGEVALKVISAKKATREPYQRFVREVTVRSATIPACCRCSMPTYPRHRRIGTVRGLRCP